MRLLCRLQNSLASGLLLFSIGTVFHLIVPSLVPALATAYADHPEVFRTWPGWTRAYMICHPFIYGFVFASGFHVIYAIKKEDVPLGTRNGAIYGLLVFAIGSLPVYLLNYGALRVPGIVITAWVTQSLLQYIAAGALLGCVTDRVVVSITTKLAQIRSCFVHTENAAHKGRERAGMTHVPAMPRAVDPLDFRVEELSHCLATLLVALLGD